MPEQLVKDLKIVKGEVSPDNSRPSYKKSDKWSFQANQIFANAPELQKMYNRLKEKNEKPY